MPLPFRAKLEGTVTFQSATKPEIMQWCTACEAQPSAFCTECLSDVEQSYRDLGLVRCGKCMRGNFEVKGDANNRNSMVFDRGTRGASVAFCLRSRMKNLRGNYAFCHIGHECLTCDGYLMDRHPTMCSECSNIAF